MRRTPFIPALLLGLVPVAGATVQEVGEVQATPATATDQDLAEVVETAITAYDEAYAAWAKRMRAANEDERRELYAERPDGEATANRMIELVKDEKGSDTQWRALSWALSSVQSSAVSKKVRPMMLEHFANKDELGALIWRMDGGEDVRRFLQAVAAKSESPAVRGPAMFAEAGMITNELQNGSLDAEQTKQAEVDAVRLLTALAAPEYADIVLYRDVTLGKSAASALFELQNLAPGKVAPDIEAEDIDGTPFKLSDYRGKVVMLDFWGDW